MLPNPESIFQAANEAIGEQDFMLGGAPYTFLRAALLPDAGEVLVDSTIDFPDSGVVSIGGEKIPYATKSINAFHADSRDPAAHFQSTGSVVYDASRIVSEIDTVRSLLVYPTSTGEYLKNLLRNAGLPIPAGMTDAQLNAYGQFCSYCPAGPLRTVAGGLGAVLTGPLMTCSATASTLTLLSGSWLAIGGRLVRIIAPSKNAGVYRVRKVVGAVAYLDPAAGEYYDAGTGLHVESACAVEIVPFDVYEDPLQNGWFHVDLLKFASFSSIVGSAYVQGGEGEVSTDSTHVTVLYAPTQVLGVYLASDTERQGTNYYTGGSVAGSVVTLGTPLPGAHTPVLVDYGALKYTAELLSGPSTDGHTYFPFYLADPAGIAGTVVDVCRAAGFLPIFTTHNL